MPVDFAHAGERFRVLPVDADAMPFGQPVDGEEPQVYAA